MSIEARLEEFVRSLLGEDAPSSGSSIDVSSDSSTDYPGNSNANAARGQTGAGRGDRSRTHRGPRHDPDYARAMADLEHYLRTGMDRPDATTRRGAGPAGGRGHHVDATTTIPKTVRRAFSALEVAPGVDFVTVTRSYKRLLAQFHPDRHASGPERSAAATEVTKRLNLAYRVIRDYYLVIGKTPP